MRTRRSLTALALTLVLTASSASAAQSRDTSFDRADRPSIVTKVKRVLSGIIKAFNQPTVPIPSTQTN